MKIKAIIKISGQKAVAVLIDKKRIICEDLADIAVEHANVFGKADEAGTLANMLKSKSIDTDASTIKLKCKDGAKMALDFMLPWDQAETEFAKISGTPEFDINLAGVVGKA